MEVSQEDLAAFLDSLSPWYPGGVPLDLVSEAAVRRLQPISVLFVAYFGIEWVEQLTGVK